jgi:hypothetical protein
VLLSEFTLDLFLRPPEWVVDLLVQNVKFNVLLSAYEANEYVVKNRHANRLHLIILRTNSEHKHNLFHPRINFPKVSTNHSEFLIFLGWQYLSNKEEQNENLKYLGLHINPRSIIIRKGVIDKYGFIGPSRRK